MKVETLEVAIEQTGGEKASSSLKNVAIAAGAAFAAYKILSKGVKAVTDAWAIQEKSLIKVRSALKASGQEVDKNTRQIENFTAALQRQTNIGDEVTISLVAQAVAMGQTATEAQRATQTAVGLSDALGIGLDAALRAVVNAQEENYQQLQRYIPALKGVTDQTEAWEIINKSAEAGIISLSAQTETFAGQTTRLNNAWGDYLEQIGRSLADGGVLAKLSSVLEGITTKQTMWNDAMENWDQLTRSQQRTYGGFSKFLADYEANVARTAHFQAQANAVQAQNIPIVEDQTVVTIAQTVATDDMIEAVVEEIAVLETLKSSVPKVAEVFDAAFGPDITAQRISGFNALGNAVNSFLRSTFGDSKAAASVMAVINTALAITNVLANIIPPFNFIAAAAVSAAGIAQIAAINGASFADGTPPGGYTVPAGYNDDSFPVSAKSGETVSISRAGEGGGGTQIVIMLDSQVLADVTTDLIANRKIVIRTSDLVA